MEPEKMVGFPEAVVGGAEGRPGPIGVPTTTAAAAGAGARPAVRLRRRRRPGGIPLSGMYPRRAGSGRPGFRHGLLAGFAAPFFGTTIRQGSSSR